MKITRDTLQTYFDASLPSIEAIADAYTFHAFEIESIEGDLLDVKVLPNRAADCNSEEGLARELAAILDISTTVQPETGELASVTATLAQINGILGSDFSNSEIEEVFTRLQLPTKVEGDTFTVTPPVHRPDLTIPEDLAEEVGQILGYDRIPAKELLPLVATPDQARYRGIERVKDILIAQGFIEVSTQSFAKSGDITLANPLDKSKPALRTSLEENLQEALMRAKQYAPLVLAPGQKPKLFEIGTIFTKEGERLEVKTSEPTTISLEIQEDSSYEPFRYELSVYHPFSLYPFMTRDIALWVPVGIEVNDIEKILRDGAGSLLTRLDQFDQFEKEGRVSYAFRLVFQSPDRTLTDDEVNAIMDTLTASLRSAGYEVR